MRTILCAIAVSFAFLLVGCPSEKPTTPLEKPKVETPAKPAVEIPTPPPAPTVPEKK